MYILKNRRHQMGADKNVINKKLGTFSCRYFNKTKSNFDRLLKKWIIQMLCHRYLSMGSKFESLAHFQRSSNEV